MWIIVEMFQLVFYSGEYLTLWINLIEGFLYVGTIVFVLSDFEYTCLISWRWQLGALCIFLSWINFVLFMSKEPTFGIYVVMFQEVLKTFLKTIPMSTLLIFAFGQTFYMLLSPVIVENVVSRILNGSCATLYITCTICSTCSQVHYPSIILVTPCWKQLPWQLESLMKSIISYTESQTWLNSSFQPTSCGSYL